MFNLLKAVLNLGEWSIKIAVLIILSPVIILYYFYKAIRSCFNRILGRNSDDDKPIDYDQPLPEDEGSSNPLSVWYRFFRNIVVTVFKIGMVTILSPVIMVYYFLKWIANKFTGNDDRSAREL